MINLKELNNQCNVHIEEILTTLNLDYKHENGWIAIRCCFHGGNDYNLKFRDGSWYCFSQCQKAYSTVDIVMKVLDISFAEALNWLCKRLFIEGDSLTLDTSKIHAREHLNRLKTMKTTREHVVYKQVDQTILNSIENYAHPYLLAQGFTKKTLEHFNIGFCRYGDLANRICFPIDAPNGTIISVSGRLPNASELGLPRYKIVEGSKKSLTLYNISRAKDSIKAQGYVVVVEGFKSCMALHEYGVDNVVACMGASISPEQRNLLLSLGVKIVVIGDNDIAGKRMSQQIYNQCYKYCEVIQINISEFTDVEKASVDDLDFDNIVDLVDKISEVVK